MEWVKKAKEGGIHTCMALISGTKKVSVCLAAQSLLKHCWHAFPKPSHQAADDLYLLPAKCKGWHPDLIQCPSIARSHTHLFVAWKMQALAAPEETGPVR